MGLSNLAKITQGLITAGRESSTPAAAIQDGTTPRQRRVIASLGTLEQVVREEGLSSPVIIIVGETVSLADRLDWFVTEEGRNEAHCLDRP